MRYSVPTLVVSGWRSGMLTHLPAVQDESSMRVRLAYSSPVPQSMMVT